jgi:hypothetical protein
MFQTVSHPVWSNAMESLLGSIRVTRNGRDGTAVSGGRNMEVKKASAD